MPSAYHEGSYAELERCLIDVRDKGHRREWWHATGRYRLGESRLLTVPIRRLRSGPRPVLPPRAELVAWAGPITGEKTARVRVYLWAESVDQVLADEGACACSCARCTRVVASASWCPRRSGMRRSGASCRDSAIPGTQPRAGV
jgi:hypothetical protein